jgi:hypothetical protein
VSLAVTHDDYDAVTVALTDYEHVTLTASRSAGDGLGSKGYTNFSIENRFEVDFREQCWAVTVALVDRTDEDSLLELGQYALGRALGRSAATP